MASVTIAIAATALLFALAIALCRRRSASVLACWALPLAVAAGSLATVALRSGIDVDESEHLHVAFLLGEGLLPYRDVDQVHTPMLWLLTAPVLRLLPETANVLLGFRALALLGFAGSVALACGLARRLAPEQAGTSTGSIRCACAFLALSAAIAGEVYIFRPDSFMAPLMLASLYLLVMAGERPDSAGRCFLVSGAAFGLAVALTPKAFQLLLLAPVAVVCFDRSRPWRSLSLFGLGASIGAAPMLLWLGWHGMFGEAFGAVAGAALGNARERVGVAGGAVSMLSKLAERRLPELGPLLLLAALGAVWALRSAGSGVRRPAAWLSVLAWGLWLAVWGLSANAAVYHVAGALTLSAALAAAPVAWLLRRATGPGRALAVGLLLALLLGSAPLRNGVQGETAGLRYPLAQVDALLAAVKLRGGRCLCLAPRHPIFVDTGSPVYLQREFYALNGQAMARFVLNEHPGVVWAGPWDELVREGDLHEEQRKTLMAFLHRGYETARMSPDRHLPGDLFWLRR